MAFGGSAQIPVRGKGNDQCPDHQRSVMFYCEHDGKLVCDRCVTLTHQGHKLQSLDVIASQKKTKIQDYLNKLNAEDKRNVKRSLKSVKDKIKTNSKAFDNLVETIRKRGEKLKKDIDKITETFIKQCKSDEKYNQDVLSQHEKELKSLFTKLNDKLNKCKEILKSENHVKVIDDDVDEEFIPPCCPEMKYLTFAEGRIPSAQMLDGIGTLYCANDSKVVSEFRMRCLEISLEKSTTDSVWVFKHLQQHLSLISMQGEIKHKVEVEFKINAISVSPSTGNLWVCCENNMVKELSGSDLTTKFTTDEEHSSIFLHASGNSLIMGTQGKVTLFSTTGKVLKTTQSNDSHLFVVPWHISVCNTTGDIAICDGDNADMGGRDKVHVTVLDSTLCVKYTYYGPSALQCCYIDVDNCQCYDALYDCQGHLLVSDFGNACIHVVSSEGQFLTLLYIDQQPCASLILMEENVLCVGFENNIKKIKYNIKSACKLQFSSQYL